MYIVPAGQFVEVGVERHTGLGIKHRGCVLADEVCQDNRIVGVGNETLVGVL